MVLRRHLQKSVLNVRVIIFHDHQRPEGWRSNLPSYIIHIQVLSTELSSTIDKIQDVLNSHDRFVNFQICTVSIDMISKTSCHCRL